MSTLLTEPVFAYFNSDCLPVPRLAPASPTTRTGLIRNKPGTPTPFLNLPPAPASILDQSGQTDTRYGCGIHQEPTLRESGDKSSVDLKLGAADAEHRLVLLRQLQENLGKGEETRSPMCCDTYGPNVPRGVGVLPGKPEVQHVALPVGGWQPPHGKV